MAERLTKEERELWVTRANEQPYHVDAGTWANDDLRWEATCQALEAEVIMPPAVKMALRVLLNHVEPGWENCRTVVEAWLNGELEVGDMPERLSKEEREQLLAKFDALAAARNIRRRSHLDGEEEES